MTMRMRVIAGEITRDGGDSDASEMQICMDVNPIQSVAKDSSRAWLPLTH